MQREAKLLKQVNMTRVVAVAISADVGRSELMNIASYPHELNIIMTPEFSNLSATNVEEQVKRAICGKLRTPFFRFVVDLLYYTCYATRPQKQKQWSSSIKHHICSCDTI